MSNSSDAAIAMSAIVRAVAGGEISPGEAVEISRFTAVLKANELESRIAALEQKQ